jgi:predicted nucleic acid-binding protein
VTTPIALERFVVDSSGWVEYLGDGPRAQVFAPYLGNPELIYLPTIVFFEVYKKLLREHKNVIAERFLSHVFDYGERVIEIDIRIAELAARTSIELNLAMADALIYASARIYDAKLITSDTHFDGLFDVILLRS